MLLSLHQPYSHCYEKSRVPEMPPLVDQSDFLKAVFMPERYKVEYKLSANSES